MPRRLLFPIAVVAVVALAAARPHPQQDVAGRARAEIPAMMARSAVHWNAGQLDAFMADYTDSATFVARKGIIRGRDAIRGVYAARFAPGAQRDSLSFEMLDIDPLGPSTAHVVARYLLHRGDSLTSSGPTSLLMRRSPAGRWRIAHDHSS
ncbi:MAG: DUF4440 domain-containing protein [Gemmatimonadaceae bacterium]|nr:DUF4440 domain-containing protein [Gemmatimonadaceae bacterium]